MTVIAGIDPGKGGAIALYRPDTGWLEIHDMPVVQDKSKSVVSPELVAAALDGDGVCHVYIERVASRPGQGVSSVFSFGDSFGILKGVCAGLRLPQTLVTPLEWKKAARIGKDKDEARGRAASLFPKYAELFARKKDDGRAEAALIAHYGARFHQ